MNNIQGFGQGQGGNPGGGGGGQGEMSCSDRIAQCWANVPLFNRFLFWSSFAIYLFSFAYEQIVYLMMNSPPAVYQNYQAWRIITAPLANMSIFMLLFGLCSYISRGMQVERMKGTVKFFIYFWWMSILSQILFVIAGFLINLVKPWPSISGGLWTMVMVDMTIDSLKDPDLARNLCCLPIQIKSKWYPYIFLVIFIFMANGMLFVAMLAGYLVGVMYTYKMLGFTEPSNSFIGKVHGCIFKHFENSPAFVSQANALGDDGAGGAGGLPMFLRQQQQQQPQNEPMPAPGVPRSGGTSGGSTGPVKPFSGKGVAVGSDMKGSNPSTYSAPQNTRDQPKGPNPNLKNSKLVKDHEAKAKQAKDESDDDDDKQIESYDSGNSRGEEDDLV